MNLNTTKLEGKRWGMIQLPQNGISVADLFYGVGIGAVGFKLAGFDL